MAKIPTYHFSHIAAFYLAKGKYDEKAYLYHIASGGRG